MFMGGIAVTNGRRCAWLVIVSAALTTVAAPLRADPGIDWAKTRVCVVGLLQWQHPEYWSSFPEAMKNRRDEQLVQTFKELGVPEKNILYLQDAQATKQRIDSRFQQLLEASHEDELLIFYFCGHGFRDRTSGQIWFANYDAGAAATSAWNVPSIFKTIDARFRGRKALLMADCCYSGALYDLARTHADSRISYAVLTSSYSHNSSTGNWTFTDSVLTGLRGDGHVDFNHDQNIQLDELARYTELEMAFVEGQKSMFHAGKDFSPKTGLKPVRAAARPHTGGRVEALSKDVWYKARVVDVDGPRSRVHYIGYADSYDEWLNPDHVRPYQPKTYEKNHKVSVRWRVDGQWYPGHVLEGWNGLHLIRYDGYDESWNEWVGPKSIQPRD